MPRAAAAGKKTAPKNAPTPPPKKALAQRQGPEERRQPAPPVRGNNKPVTGGVVRPLNEDEAAVLIFVRIKDEENPQRGATIDEIEAHMGEVPSHQAVQTLLQELGCLQTPLTEQNVAMSRNLVCTDRGYALGAKYANGDLKATRVDRVPKGVNLPGDEEPVPPRVENDGRQAPSGQTGTATGRSRGSFVAPPRR